MGSCPTWSRKRDQENAVAHHITAYSLDSSEITTFRPFIKCFGSGHAGLSGKALLDCSVPGGQVPHGRFMMISTPYLLLVSEPGRIFVFLLPPRHLSPCPSGVQRGLLTLFTVGAWSSVEGYENTSFMSGVHSRGQRECEHSRGRLDCDRFELENSVLDSIEFDILHALLAIWRRMTTLGLWTPDLLAREFLSS